MAHERCMYPGNTVVWSRSGKTHGHRTGRAPRKCSIPDCPGMRFPVRWLDRRTTWPCSDTMQVNGEGALVIIGHKTKEK